MDRIGKDSIDSIDSVDILYYPIASIFPIPLDMFDTSGDQRINRTPCALAVAIPAAFFPAELVDVCPRQTLNPPFISIYPKFGNRHFRCLNGGYTHHFWVYTLVDVGEGWIWPRQCSNLKRPEVYLGTSSALQRLCGCRHVVHHRGWGQSWDWRGTMLKWVSKWNTVYFQIAILPGKMMINHHDLSSDKPRYL